MNEIRIPYKPNKIVFLLAIGFFGACAGVMGYAANTNSKGLVISRIIEFSTQGATVFYWVIAGLALIFVLLGIYALARSATTQREIVISENSLKSPKNGFSKIDVTVNLSDVSSINIQTIQKTRILNIEYPDGTLSIPDSMLPSKQAFEELVSHVQDRVNV